MNLNNLFNEEKVRLDPKCWTGKKIGNPKTKMKGGVRVNNCVPAESIEEAREIRNKKGRLLGTWDGREFTVDPGTQAWLIDELGPESAEQWVDNKTAELRKQSAPSEDQVKYYANELEKSDAQAGRPRQSRQRYYDLAVQMLSDQQGLAEGSELKQAKRKYNQAAKDANLDQVGAGKKIDTMKKSLRQKDVDNKKQGVAEGWRDIYNLNKQKIGTNPNLIKPNTVLKMPDGSRYKVKPGDNLSSIAKTSGTTSSQSPSTFPRFTNPDPKAKTAVEPKYYAMPPGAGKPASGKPAPAAQNDRPYEIDPKSGVIRVNPSGIADVFQNVEVPPSPTRDEIYQKMMQPDLAGPSAPGFKHIVTGAEGEEHEFDSGQEAKDFVKKIEQLRLMDLERGGLGTAKSESVNDTVKEVSLGDYRKKAQMSQAGAKINRFFDRDNPEKVSRADQTIAKRERGLARADARRKPYTPPSVDMEKRRQELTDKYPNIDELVRRAELNRDPNYEYADGQAYYAGQEAEQKYQRLKQIQRIIQGLDESKTLSDYMDEAKGINSIRNPYDLQPLEGPMGGGGGGSTRSGPSPFGPKPGSREASIAQPTANTMTVKQGPNPDYRPQTTGDKPKVNVKPGETMDQAVQRTKTQQEFGKFLQGQSGQTFGAGGGRGGQGGPTAAQANTMSNAPVSVKNKPSAMNSMARDLTNPPKPTNTNTTTTNNAPRQNDRVDPLDMPRDPLDIRPGYDGRLGSNPGPNTADKKSSWLGKTAKGLGYAAGAYGAADIGSRALDYYQNKDQDEVIIPDIKENKKREQPEVEYDDDYDAMVARVKKLAGLGPMRTVYDPKKRQYRNMPTAQQPKK